MQLKNLNEALNKYGKYVVQQSRSNLTRGKKNVDKKLYNSLQYEIKEKPLALEFSMEYYGTFQDKGVSGRFKKYNTPYSYKSKQPPSKPFEDWAKKRNIRLRDSRGRFQKGNYKTIAFLIARSVYRKGIKPSLFFTKPFEKGFERYSNDVAKGFIDDIDKDLNNGN